MAENVFEHVLTASGSAAAFGVRARMLREQAESKMKTGLPNSFASVCRQNFSGLILMARIIKTNWLVGRPDTRP